MSLVWKVLFLMVQGDSQWLIQSFSSIFHARKQAVSWERHYFLMRFQGISCSCQILRKLLCSNFENMQNTLKIKDSTNASITLQISPKWKLRYLWTITKILVKIRIRTNICMRHDWAHAHFITCAWIYTWCVLVGARIFMKIFEVIQCYHMWP